MDLKYIFFQSVRDKFVLGQRVQTVKILTDLAAQNCYGQNCQIRSYQRKESAFAQESRVPVPSYETRQMIAKNLNFLNGPFF